VGTEQRSSAERKEKAGAPNNYLKDEAKKKWERREKGRSLWVATLKIGKDAW